MRAARASADELREAAELLAGHIDLGLDRDSGELDGETLLQALAEALLPLVQRDIGALTQLLYRIDVSERAAGEALQGAEALGDASTDLAEVVLDRVLLTVASRRAFEAPEDDA